MENKKSKFEIDNIAEENNYSEVLEIIDHGGIIELKVSYGILSFSSTSISLNPEQVSDLREYLNNLEI